ncbi:ABC transporter ATP-binding protein [Paraflavisolibacter sp. H34]|uniref:peptidase domain-containing ABC transporter n=1 Tax=Huijunlia imazamoxiresistens TaxID=3127457 RepID=UPI00301A1661
MFPSSNPLARIARLVREERTEISSIYFYAILNGLIQLSLPLGIQAIVGFVQGGAVSTSLIVLIVLIVAGVLCTGLLQTGQMKFIERIQQKLFVRYAYAFAGHIPRLDLKSVDAYYLPELVNRFFEIPTLQKSLSKLLLDFPSATIQILFGLVLLSLYHPVFIFLGLLLVGILAVIFYFTGNRGLQSSLAESSHKYAVAGWLEEVARVVKSFKFSVNTGLHLKKTDQKVISYLSERKAHFSILLFQYRALVALKVLVTAAMLVVGSLLLLNQQINIGQFVASEIIILLVIGSVEKLIVNLDSVYDIITSIEKINKLTEKPAESEGKFLLPEGEGVRVDLKEVTFGYTEGAPVLRGVTIAVNKGEKVCITGTNGSGRSSLLKLLTGAYNNFSGSVLINEIPIGNYQLQALRAQTGLLLHQQDVFHGTLWENISMGAEDIDKAYVLDLARQTGLLPFISSLKEGFDAELDPTGKRLPRNVVQKILLVRALARKPQLLLLDEPGEGIEAQYQQQIRNMLLHGMEGVTLLVVTQDPEWIRQCHQVIRLSH